MVVAGVRCAGRGRKTYECVKEDMKALDSHPEYMGSVQGYAEGHHFGRNV